MVRITMEPLPAGPYRTILADPPWPYRQVLGRGKGEGDTTRGGLPYSALTVAEISSIPIRDITYPDAQLWLWTTNSHLHSALHVMEAWGFTFVTAVTWDKEHFGLGYWIRGQTEHLLFGIRGNPRERMQGPHGATGKAWSTLIREGRRQHSTKPRLAYAMIEDMGEPPRIELFARGRRSGWDAWGLEVPAWTQELLE